MSSAAVEFPEYEFSAGPPLVERPSRGRRARRAFTRYLIAICIGVAATLAWQSYGNVIKQTVATKAPGLGWSPEVQQLIAASVQQLGWTKPTGFEGGAPPAAAPETAQQAPGAQAAADPAASAPSAVPSPTLEQMQQIASDVVALKQAVTQLSSNQDQMALDIAKVQATDQEVLNKISANKVAANSKVAADKLPPSPPQTAAHKYPPGSAARSEPPLPRPLPLH